MTVSMEQQTSTTRRIEFSMHALAASVYLVRNLVNQAALAWALPEDTRHTAALILTELTTNAVKLYPGVPIEVWVANPDDGVLEMAVWDPDPTKGPRLSADGDLMEENGRGLHLVHELCEGQAGWYVSEMTGGKVVWARLKFSREAEHERS